MIIILLLGVGCNSPSEMVESPSPIGTEPAITPTAFQPVKNSLFISAGIPQTWRFILEDQSGMEITDSPNTDSLILSQRPPTSDETDFGQFNLIYAAVVQFPTVDDDITMEEIQGLWNGTTGDTYDELLIDEETILVFKELWGNDPSSNVKINDPSEILDAAWSKPKSVAIIPFEAISPRWKVLKLRWDQPPR